LLRPGQGKLCPDGKMADPRLTTVHDALAWARSVLAGDSESIDAPLLLMHVLGVDRAALLTHPERELTPEQATSFCALIEQRAAGVPVPYLTGSRAFYDLDFAVTPDVLIPRPETEHLIESALQWARRDVRLVDVGTGSGAIAVTLAVHLPEARVWAVDVSAAALEVARQNAIRHGAAERITFVQGDLLEPLIAADQPIDLVVANLPYIASDELKVLPVALHEPLLALDGGADGLDLIRRLLDQAPRVLAQEGLLLMEIAAGQGARVCALSRVTFPGAHVTLIRDYAGLDRVVRVAL
jgi:release factor glutamine methyltransferase